jgi:hypothetical protein
MDMNRAVIIAVESKTKSVFFKNKGHTFSASR